MQGNPTGTCEARIVMGRAGGSVPQDQVIWSFALDGAGTSLPNGLDVVNACLSAIEAGVGLTGVNWLQQMDVDYIEVFDAGGGPAYYVQGFAGEVNVGTAASTFGFLNLRVGRLIETPRGPADKGGIFIGPIATGAAPVATTAFVTQVGTMVQNMHLDFVASGFTPVLVSKIAENAERADILAQEIVGYRVDNSWDVLKSRRAPETEFQDFAV